MQVSNFLHSAISVEAFDVNSKCLDSYLKTKFLHCMVQDRVVLHQSVSANRFAGGLDLGRRWCVKPLAWANMESIEDK